MKYQFNIKPIIIEAENEKKAWEKYDEGNWSCECDDMEEKRK
jgi:hypothetical protein